MKKRHLLEQLEVVYAAWEQERNEYKSENDRLRHELAKMTRQNDAWRQYCDWIRRV